MTLKSTVITVGLVFVGLIIAAAILGPVLWGIVISLKTRVDALSMPPHWIFSPTISNYEAAFATGPYAQTILNSLIIAGTSSVLAMILGVPGRLCVLAFAFQGEYCCFPRNHDYTDGTGYCDCPSAISYLCQLGPN